MFKDLKIKTLILGSVIYFVFCTQAFAANVFMDTENKNFYLGQDNIVDFYLNPEGESLNAVSGKIIFDKNILEIKEVRDGNSSINFWIEKPKDDKSGEVSFSGITPGGLSLNKNLLFSIVFKPKIKTNGTIGFDDLELLKNDGSGSSASVSKQDLNFSVLDGGDNISIPQEEDNNPPEDFKPQIAMDPEIFDGKYFIVFVAQDKGVGIDHYEVKEGFFGKYIEAESPYLIKSESINKKFYVKAVDKAFNKKIASAENNYAVFWYQDYKLFGIMIAVVVLGFVFKKSWKKFYAKIRH